MDVFYVGLGYYAKHNLWKFGGFRFRLIFIRALIKIRIFKICNFYLNFYILFDGL